MPIDTTTVTERRTLHFSSPAEALADAVLIVASDRAGTLRRAGNWTAGQCLSHIAAWIDYAFDGFPAELAVPPDLAAACREALPRILEGSMDPGFITPGAESRGGAFGADDIPAEEALGRLRRAWARLAAHRPPLEDPFFGDLTHEQAVAITLRHAELHQSFQIPAG